MHNLKTVKKMNRYDPTVDFIYNDIGVSSVLYILGFSDNEINNASIDDAIKAIRDRYKYKHELTIRGQGSPTYVASDEFVKKQNLILSRTIRRFFHNRHLSEFAINNEKK